MGLKVGDAAKDFSVRDYLGNSIRLEDLRGKNTLLAFFRNAECALCNLRMHQLINAYPDLQSRGLKILAVFESGADRIRASVGSKSVPFPLIPDPENDLYRLYGVGFSWIGVVKTILTAKKEIQEAADLGFEMKKAPGMKMDRMPAEFLIGPDLRLKLVKFSKKVTDHIPLNDLKSIVADFRQPQPQYEKTV
ncbi:redoxin [Leptospira gomenensis]|uniref:Redoxin n=1 Tax=Leptospira gomenensis TaxID=2484974 RepID=A0A5F1YAE5_9LEPT|nr:peroxiredoxin-like family protein [Leptospira gomenensis]TGK33289.1 redoxin [Leptospira gomenensis]TGK45118.1 redoxin [Leptospira gomenensis]TGK50903.1 redoxin [Leptospira gomenensis]TGK56526.1 redoxin [Leptospira gomenensis]